MNKFKKVYEMSNEFGLTFRESFSLILILDNYENELKNINELIQKLNKIGLKFKMQPLFFNLKDNTQKVEFRIMKNSTVIYKNTKIIRTA